MALRDLLRDVSPPFLWRAASAFRHGRPTSPNYQGVTTLANLSALHGGRFAEVYDAAYRRDPGLLPDGNTVRLRVYQSYLFATIASKVKGDFVSVGISYGVTAKVIYELVLRGRERTYHLVDPFTDDSGAGYCKDAPAVMRQFGGDPFVRLHRAAAPQVFPLDFVGGLAFAELSTGDDGADLESLPYLVERLHPEGVIVLDDYAWGPWMSRLDEEARALGASIFCLPTGQGVLLKEPSTVGV